MFPIHDDNPTLRTSYVLYGFILLNFISWIFIQGAGLDEDLLSLTVTNLGISGVGVASGNWYQFLTAPFMHASWDHLLFNMLFLWIFGNNVEDATGALRFIVFYLLCGAVSATPEIFMGPEIPMVGASGAIAAVMGAYLVLYPKARVYVPLWLIFRIFVFRIPAFLVIGFYMLVYASGFMDEAALLQQPIDENTEIVAHGAHFVGLVSGALLILLFRNVELLKDHPYAGWSAEIPPAQPLPKILKSSIDTINFILLGALVVSLLAITFA
jgi:membrane associated rhomboid family serine protease